MRADKEVGAQVDLNPKLLAAIFGEKQGAIEEAIVKLCSPDGQSTSKMEEGRRLVRVGQFAYRVVNGAHYMAIRDLEHKRQYDREQKRKQRAKPSKPLPGEVAFVKAEARGDVAEADRIAARGLPPAAALPAVKVPEQNSVSVKPVSVNQEAVKPGISLPPALPDPAPAAVPVPLAPAPQPAASATPEPEPEPKRKLYTMDEIKRMTEAQRAQAQQGVIPGKGLFTP